MAENQQTVLCTVEGGVAWVTLNRPEKMNALSKQLKDEFRQIFQALAEDDHVKVVVLTGNGRAFCAGADLSEVHVRETFRRRRESMDDPPNIVREFQKPVIGLINGYALGGGLELALGCDIRIASETAQLGFPEVKHGWLPAGGGGTQALPRAIGEGKAMLMALTGDPIDAPSALEWGLVEKVFPQNEVDARAREIAARMAEHRLPALILIKSAIRMASQSGLLEGLHYERELSAIAYQLQGKEEAVSAFFEKRKPDFGDEK